MTSSLFQFAVSTAALAALAACASDRTTAQRDATSATAGNTAWTAGSGPAHTSSPGAASGASTNANAAATTGATATGAATPHHWSGVVIGVDPILRQDAAAMGVGMAGAAAAGGTMSNQGSPNDKVYRITMRADDGTTQVVILDSIPTYKSGDRVRYRDGAIQRE